MDVENLVCAAKTDRGAADQLFALIRRHLAKVVRRWIKDRDVDDVIQNTLIAVSRKLDEFEPRGRGSFYRWVRGFARIEAREQLRRHHRHASLCEAVSARAVWTPTTNLSSWVERGQRLELVQQEARKLPPAQQRAIVNDLAGGDAGLLASAEGISREYARVLQSRARRSLRRRVVVRMRPRM